MTESITIQETSQKDFQKRVREYLAKGYVLDGEVVINFREKDNEPLYVQNMIAKSLTV